MGKEQGKNVKHIIKKIECVCVHVELIEWLLSVFDHYYYLVFVGWWKSFVRERHCCTTFLLTHNFGYFTFCCHCNDCCCCRCCCYCHCCYKTSSSMKFRRSTNKYTKEKIVAQNTIHGPIYVEIE